MEVLGFLGAVIGLIAALINRKRIVVHTTAPDSNALVSSQHRPAITIGKRLKRACLAVGIGICCIVIAAIADPAEMGRVSKTMAFPFVIGIVIAAYQMLAIVIMIIGRLWR